MVEYSKTCLKRPLSKDQKLVFKTNYRLMQDKSIAVWSKGSILQYFWPSLGYRLSLRSLFCLFLSGRLRQVLLYSIWDRWVGVGTVMWPWSLYPKLSTCWTEEISHDMSELVWHRNAPFKLCIAVSLSWGKFNLQHITIMDGIMTYCLINNIHQI